MDIDGKVYLMERSRSPCTVDAMQSCERCTGEVCEFSNSQTNGVKRGNEYLWAHPIPHNGWRRAAQLFKVALATGKVQVELDLAVWCFISWVRQRD